MDLDKLSPHSRHERRVAMPLEALPEGLVARAMDHIAAEAVAGRARPVAAPPTPAWLRLARGELISPRALRLAGFLVIAAAFTAALASIWLGMGALARGGWMLELRAVGLEARLALRSMASPLLPAAVMGLAALTCVLLSILDPGPRAVPAKLRPVT